MVLEVLVDCKATRPRRHEGNNSGYRLSHSHGSVSKLRFIYLISVMMGL